MHEKTVVRKTISFVVLSVNCRRALHNRSSLPYRAYLAVFISCLPLLIDRLKVCQSARFVIIRKAWTLPEVFDITQSQRLDSNQLGFIILSWGP